MSVSAIWVDEIDDPIRGWVGIVIAIGSGPWDGGDGHSRSRDRMHRLLQVGFLIPLPQSPKSDANWPIFSHRVPVDSSVLWVVRKLRKIYRPSLLPLLNILYVHCQFSLGYSVGRRWLNISLNSFFNLAFRRESMIGLVAFHLCFPNLRPSVSSDISFTAYILDLISPYASSSGRNEWMNVEISVISVGSDRCL